MSSVANINSVSDSALISKIILLLFLKSYFNLWVLVSKSISHNFPSLVPAYILFSVILTRVFTSPQSSKRYFLVLPVLISNS
ncbi:MAG: hypothetical protein H9Q65_05775 [Spiroplasma ixodetis]|nr:hypothetical protein [Spiroplasma ixodetis]